MMSRITRDLVTGRLLWKIVELSGIEPTATGL